MAIWLSKEEPPQEPKVYNPFKLTRWLLVILLGISIIGFIIQQIPSA